MYGMSEKRFMTSKTLRYHKLIPLQTKIRLLNSFKFSFKKFSDLDLLIVVKDSPDQTEELPY